MTSSGTAVVTLPTDTQILITRRFGMEDGLQDALDLLEYLAISLR